MKFNTYNTLTIAFYAVAVVLSIIFLLFNLKYPLYLVCGFAFLFHCFGIVYVKD